MIYTEGEREREARTMIYTLRERGREREREREAHQKMSSTSVRLRPHSSQACFSARSVSNPISAGATMSSFASAGSNDSAQRSSQPARACLLPASGLLLTAGEEVDVVRREPDEGVAEADALPAALRHRPIAAIHHLLRPEGPDEGVRRAGLRHRPLHTHEPRNQLGSSEGELLRRIAWDSRCRSRGCPGRRARRSTQSRGAC